MGKEERLPGLDELRGLAIGLVVLSHVGPVFGAGGVIGALFLAPAWGVGVDLFFVISGLVVERSLHGLRRDRGALEASLAFYVRRAMRIVPLAWCVAGILSFGLIFPAATILPDDVWAALTFTSNAHWARCFGGGAGCGNPMAFAPFWSVAMEMQFYLVAPLLVLLLPRPVLLALAGFVLLVSLGLHRPWGGTLWTFRMDALAVGIAIGAIMETRLWLPLIRWLPPIGNVELLFWMTVAALMLAILPPATHGVATTILALLCALIVIRATIRQEGGLNAFGRAMRRLGSVSYALYLVHLPVLALGEWSLGETIGSPAAAALSIAAALGLARGLTAGIGEPLRQLGRRWTPQRIREVSP